jgi:hypothetical protein
MSDGGRVMGTLNNQVEKLSEPIMVRCSERDVQFLDKFIQDCGGEISYGAAFRAFMRYFQADYDAMGPSGCLMKLIGKI